MNRDFIKQQFKNFASFKNIFLVVIVIALTILPLFIAKEAEFIGSDDKAKNAIQEINPNYKQWVSPIWKPPSSEIESLFALQAAIGAGVIGYCIGFMRGRKSKQEE